jgi:hypothetical protein
MTNFKVNRIAVPAWGEQPHVERINVVDEEYQSIQLRRELLLVVVHDEVERYLNDPALVSRESRDDFPSLLRLTGDYYISKELYERLDADAKIVIGIKTRFLEKPWYPNQDNCDYLGLDVWISCDPKSWHFTACRNTDSSVI